VGPPIAKLVHITPITMAYDTQVTRVKGVYKPTNITGGGAHCIYLFSLGCQPLATWDDQAELVAAILHSHPSCPIVNSHLLGYLGIVFAEETSKKCGNTWLMMVNIWLMYGYYMVNDG